MMGQDYPEGMYLNDENPMANQIKVKDFDFYNGKLQNLF